MKWPFMLRSTYDDWEQQNTKLNCELQDVQFERDTAIAVRDAAITQRDSAVAERDAVIRRSEIAATEAGNAWNRRTNELVAAEDRNRAMLASLNTREKELADALEANRKLVTEADALRAENAKLRELNSQQDASLQTMAKARDAARTYLELSAAQETHQIQVNRTLKAIATTHSAKLVKLSAELAEALQLAAKAELAGVVDSPTAKAELAGVVDSPGPKPGNGGEGSGE